MRRDGQKDHDVKAEGKTVVDSLLVSDNGLPCLCLGTMTPCTSVALRFLYTFDKRWSELCHKMFRQISRRRLAEEKPNVRTCLKLTPQLLTEKKKYKKAKSVD